MEAKTQKKLIWSWAFYDWANSAFATTVMAVFFPIFFKSYWMADAPATQSTYVLGLTNSIASLLLAFMAPTLGAVADQGAWRKRFLLIFTLVGAVASSGLALVGQGQWIWAVSLFSLGIIGFNGGLPFYDALLMQVSDLKSLDRVSALGYGLGYLGGGLLLTLNVIMFSKFTLFGFADQVDAVKFAFFTVGAWWLLFSIPLFLYVVELPARLKQSWGANVRQSWTSLKSQTYSLKDNKPLLFFLLAFLLYNDAVNTIVKMAVDYGLAIGLKQNDLIGAILLVQFIGFPSAILFGYIGSKYSPKGGIWFCLATYLGVTVYAYYLQSAFEFYLLAATIGVVQGGIQALSRSYYARLVTPEESAQYFGFFNMIGKFSSIIGPFLVGWVSLSTGNPRAGILILAVFFVAGGWLLNKSGREMHAEVKA